MEVQVNHQSIQIFEGAKVKDVIRKFSLEVYKDIVNGKKTVVNQYRDQILLNGELVGTEHLFIVNSEEV